MKLRALLVLTLLVLIGGVTANSRAAQAATATASSCANHTGANALTGSIDGALYEIEMPATWNGTLVLYSHGYVFPGSPQVATDVGDAATGAALLNEGYALAGSSYSSEGWALQQAFHDQIALLDYFDSYCGQPTRTIAWGHSLGGIITAGLIQLYPDRFNGALPMCGVLAGGVGTWNQALDSAFAFDVLLAGNSLPIVNLPTNPVTLNNDFNAAEGALYAAQQTAQGQARIALLAALGDIPGWYNSALPEPAANDYASQEQNQYLWESQVDFLFAFFARAELEARAGGNPSWNTNVNYHTQLAHSADAREVENLYKQAGLSLNQDLNTLNATPRISANPGAVSYLNQYISFDGQLNFPVLTMHTTGDGLVVPEDEQAYKSVVGSTGDSNLLRQIFVHRAGHCTFTPAETLAAFQTLINRMNTGEWGNSTDPTLLNAEAEAWGPTFNVAPPAFTHFEPPVFLRPFDSRNTNH